MVVLNMQLNWFNYVSLLDYHCVDYNQLDLDFDDDYFINTSLCLMGVINWRTCRDCKYYEEDYLETESATLHGEWCHKTGKAERFTAWDIKECKDYEIGKRGVVLND